MNHVLGPPRRPWPEGRRYGPDTPTKGRASRHTLTAWPLAAPHGRGSPGKPPAPPSPRRRPAQRRGQRSGSPAAQQRRPTGPPPPHPTTAPPGPAAAHTPPPVPSGAGSNEPSLPPSHSGHSPGLASPSQRARALRGLANPPPCPDLGDLRGRWHSSISSSPPRAFNSQVLEPDSSGFLDLGTRRKPVRVLVVPYLTGIKIPGGISVYAQCNSASY